MRCDPDALEWSDFRLVDTHLHVWDLADPRLTYSYLAPDFVHPQLGDISALRRDFSVADFRADVGRVRVERAVHVQAAFGTADPYDETLFVDEVMHADAFPTVMVFNTDLTATDVDEQIERHTRHPAVRGVRDQRDGDTLWSTAYVRGCARLVAHGLHLEVEHWDDLSPVAHLANALPELQVMLDHAGRPSALDETTRLEWKHSMEVVAAAPNTWCKISGLDMADPRWTLDRMTPFVETCIEVFGIERCCFGSNWPVQRMYSSYEVLVTAIRLATSGLSASEQHALFVGNAERMYRL
ncbi:MAG: amidohydrolase [Ilumatobacteraceae bacterium]|jgi:predicted TIM-barrel fold metal-dependent hydrolase